MTSRVEELQRMCDNINENGGLDSGEWHTALLAQIAQNLAVIADVMMADRKTEPSIDIIRCKDCDNYAGEGMYCAWNVLTGDMGYCHHARPKGSTDITAEQTEPTVSKMEQVEDEPKTQMKTQNSNLAFEKRTMRDCYNCKRYETEGECIECHYEPKDEPQTERRK